MSFAGVSPAVSGLLMRAHMVRVERVLPCPLPSLAWDSRRPLFGPDRVCLWVQLLCGPGGILAFAGGRLRCRAFLQTLFFRPLAGRWLPEQEKVFACACVCVLARVRCVRVQSSRCQ
eukprot:15472599-Alexandrium_andersonii.AAC.1